jgi:hypothetical protein
MAILYSWRKALIQFRPFKLGKYYMKNTGGRDTFLLKHGSMWNISRAANLLLSAQSTLPIL